MWLHVNYNILGSFMKSGSQVGNFVVNALCQKYFMDDRPNIWKKHYFLSSVGVSMFHS